VGNQDTRVALRHQRFAADGSLLAVAAVWGVSFVVMKDVLVSMAPMLMLLVRQLVGFVVVAPFPHGLVAAHRRDWVIGGALGIMLSLGWIAETFGLAHTTPGKAGFIISLSVAIVPFLAAVVTGHSPVRAQVAGALLATAGLAALSLRGNLTLSLGDGLCLLAAALFACQIVVVGVIANDTSPLVLTVTQLAAGAAFFCILTPLVDPMRLPHTWKPWLAVVWLGIFTISVPFFVQAWAQRRIASSEAAILLSFTGLFAGVSAVLLWAEPLTWHLVVGAGGITGGLLVVELARISKRAPEDGVNGG
jgi:drug/metabolite transporter (DMT)-like permease